MAHADYKPISTKVIQGKASRWWTSLIHLVPIGLSAFILYLSYSCKYWFPETHLYTGMFTAKAKNVLNWLQLAAKLYEIVVVASMAAITLKAYKRIFVDTGIPFGLLSGPYRIGDVFYLISGAFWRGLGYINWTEPSQFTWKDFKILVLAALVIVNTLLSQLVGPASAILIVPELDWFPLPNAFSNTIMPIFYNGKNDVIWPTRLDENLWITDNDTIPACRLERGAFLYYCPGAGFSDLFTWAAGWEFSNLPNNITFQDPSGAVSRRLDMKNNTNGGTFVTTPTALTAKTLGQFKSQVRSKDLGAISQAERWKVQYKSSAVNYQPLVQAKCNIWNTKSPGKAELKDMKVPYGELDCFDEAPGGDCHQIKDKLFNTTISENLASDIDDVTYVFDTTNSMRGETGSPSTLMFAAGLPWFSDGKIGGLRVVGCSYMAHWVPARPVIDPTNTEYIKTNITDLDVFFTGETEAAKKKAPTVGPVINIDRSWIPYLDLIQTDDDKINVTQENEDAVKLKVAGTSYSVGMLLNAMIMYQEKTNSSNVEYFFGPGSTWKGRADDETVKQIIEKFTGAIVADAIARTSADIDALMINQTNDHKDRVSLDLLFVQQGPNSFPLNLFQNGTVRGGTANSQIDNFHNLRWNDLAGLQAAIRENVAWVDFDPKQYGYGFGQPGPPMRFALTVIITYLSLLLLYWIVGLFLRTNTVAPWSDIQDLLALAWSSPAPPELKGQGAKVVDKQLWREGVSVRARSNSLGDRPKYVSLVLGDDNPGMERIRKREDYF